jgi:hypothetical protein
MRGAPVGAPRGTSGTLGNDYSTTNDCSSTGVVAIR